MSIIPQFKKIFVKYYLHRSFIISIYVNLKRQNYIHKPKGVILIATYLFLCWKQLGSPRHGTPDDMRVSFKSHFTRLDPSALIVTLLLWISQLHSDLLKILWKVLYFKTRKKRNTLLLQQNTAKMMWGK